MIMEMAELRPLLPEADPECVEECGPPVRVLTLPWLTIMQLPALPVLGSLLSLREGIGS